MSDASGTMVRNMRDPAPRPVPGGRILADGSLLVVEAAARAGADVFVGYPITPANLLYLHSSRRFPLVLPAPDEITTLQWMAGLSAAGRMPLTATSYPGFALMLESIGMAFMMELPMLVVLAQRLGPATGTATCGAQGDILLMAGINSGGYPIPVFCPSCIEECWTLAARAVRTALELRTPVVLLTSKEMVTTLRDVDPGSLPPVEAAPRTVPEDSGEYLPYRAAQGGVPPFVPVGDDLRRVRLTASTHDERGDLQHTSAAALANTRRLHDKIVGSLPSYTEYEYDGGPGGTLLLAFDHSAEAAREALELLRSRGRAVSLLVPRTLFPVPGEYLRICASHDRVVVVEENLDGQYRKILFGAAGRAGVSGVNAVGRMISPGEIAAEVER